MIEHSIATVVTVPKVDNKTNHISDFIHLVKGGGWQKLSPAIIERFNVMSEGRYTNEYKGNMVVKRSKLGLLFSFICKLFESPLVAR